MKAIKRAFVKESPRELGFKSSCAEYMQTLPGSVTEQRALAAMEESLHEGHVSVEDALSIFKMHVKQGCGHKVAHRVRALNLLHYFAIHSSSGPHMLAILCSPRWTERLKECAVKSYSPQMQDAVVQLVYKFASKFRTTEWGDSMKQLLVDLEGEGIIVEGTWTLDGVKPQVTALVGKAAKHGGAAGSGDGPSRSSTASTLARNTSLGGSGGSEQLQPAMSEASLLEKAELMSEDAVALACASDALSGALSKAQEATAPSGNNSNNSNALAAAPALAELAKARAGGAELSARCAKHLARLQAALANATHLSDRSTAQLCELADALNTHQQRWQQLAKQALEHHQAHAPPKALASAAPAPAPAKPSAPVPDLLSLDDDTEMTASTAGSPPSPIPNAVAVTIDPFDMLSGGLSSPEAPYTPAPAAPAPAAVYAAAATANASTTNNPFASATTHAAMAVDVAAAPARAFSSNNPFASTNIPGAPQPTSSAPVVVATGMAAGDPFAALMANKLPPQAATPPPMRLQATPGLPSAAPAQAQPTPALEQVQLPTAMAALTLTEQSSPQGQQQQQLQVAAPAASTVTVQVPAFSSNPFAAHASPAPLASAVTEPVSTTPARAAPLPLASAVTEPAATTTFWSNRGKPVASPQPAASPVQHPWSPPVSPGSGLLPAGCAPLGQQHAPVQQAWVNFGQ